MAGCSVQADVGLEKPRVTHRVELEPRRPQSLPTPRHTSYKATSNTATSHGLSICKHTVPSAPVGALGRAIKEMQNVGQEEARGRQVTEILQGLKSSILHYLFFKK